VLQRVSVPIEPFSAVITEVSPRISRCAVAAPDQILRQHVGASWLFASTASRRSFSRCRLISTIGRPPVRAGAGRFCCSDCGVGVQDTVHALLLKDLQVVQIDLRVLVINAEDQLIVVRRNVLETTCAIAV